jgi:penicillin-binding protein 2
LQILARKEVNPELRQRISRLIIFAAIAFGLLFFRLWMLQVVQGAHYGYLAENNRIRLIRIPSTRGTIYDRKGNVLVSSRPSFDLSFVPEDSPNLDATISELARQLGMEKNQIESQITEAEGTLSYIGIRLMRDLSWERLARIEARQLDLPGVNLFVFPRRSYPYGAFGAHLIGYIGEINKGELSRLKKDDYRMGDEVGRSGIEKVWEAFLRGQKGGQQVEVDALGRRLRVLHEVEEVPGYNLLLTLDRDLQKKATEVMEGKEGSIVAIDVRDGSILAMVSSPSFDPNHFANGISPEEWTRLTEDKLHPLNNRTLQGQYPPGSTFKIIMAAAALEEGVISPGTRFYDSGGLPFGNRVFRCWKKGGHGWMDLHQAIVQSCDVYFYQVGLKLGVDRIAHYARAFGLGKKTGIALEHEKEGLVPDSQWKQKRLGQPWFPGETPSLAIGQGYLLATPLQMAMTMSAVANGGTIYRPWYLKSIETHDGVPLQEYQRENLGHLPLRRSTLEILHKALGDAVGSGAGTGGRARIDGIQVAGKTGTAQVIQGQGHSYETRDHAWFIAFAPADKPEIAVAALIEHGGHGGAAAAPRVREILQEYFHLQGIRIAHRQETGSSF